MNSRLRARALADARAWLRTFQGQHLIDLYTVEALSDDDLREVADDLSLTPARLEQLIRQKLAG